MSTDSTPPDRPRSRRVLIAVLGLAVLVLAGLVAYQGFARDSSRAGGVMVFEIECNPSLLRPSAQVDPAALERFGQTQAALVRSRHTLIAAINTPGVLESALFRDADPDALNWLANNLRVTLNPSSNLMTVELDGENEKEVLRVLNAISKAYLDTTEELTRSSRMRWQDELEKVIAERTSEQRRDTDRLQRITASIGEGSPRLATLAIDDQFRAKELEKIVDELRRARLDRSLYLANPPAPLHKGPESAPIAVAGGAPAALPHQPAAAPDGLDTLEGKACAVREQYWSRELALMCDVIQKFNDRSYELNNLRREIRAREADLERYHAAVQELRAELRAPPRVMMVEAPYFRPGK